MLESGEEWKGEYHSLTTIFGHWSLVVVLVPLIGGRREGISCATYDRALWAQSLTNPLRLVTNPPLGLPGGLLLHAALRRFPCLASLSRPHPLQRLRIGTWRRRVCDLKSGEERCCRTAAVGFSLCKALDHTKLVFLLSR